MSHPEIRVQYDAINAVIAAAQEILIKSAPVADEGVEVIEDALIEAIELRSLLLIDPGIGADRAEKAGGERRIDAFEQLQEDQTDRVSVGEELIAARVGELGDEPFGAEL